MLDLTKLNESQLNAVTKIDGPMAVIAGAGSGKTRTLTYRIAYMIAEGIKPDNIVAVTFTNKAAFEMKSRVINLIGDKAMELKVSTFHSFCAGFLRDEIDNLDLGFSRRFLILDEDDSKQIIRDTVKELGYDSNLFNSNRLKDYFSKYKNGQFDSLDFEEYKIYQGYNNYLQANNSLDFDDLILYAIEILKTRKTIKAQYNERYQYILVDEFQDTNYKQYELIKLLAGKRKNVFVVGDPDQSIYSFRGANYENQKYFIKEFNPKIVILDHNYRSTMNILNVANKLIVNNLFRSTEKELKSSLGDGKEVIIETRATDRDEAYFVTKAIEILIENGYRYDEIAVLYRSNALGRVFEEAFLKYQIPYVIYGGVSFFARKEIKDIIAYIRVALNPHDNISLKRIINMPRRKIGQVTVAKLENYAKVFKVSLFEAISEADISYSVNQRLLEFKELIFKLQKQINQTKYLIDVIDIVSNLTGYQEMLKLEGNESKDRLENIEELKAIFYMGEQEIKGNPLEILTFILDELSLKTDLDLDKGENTVKLATVHQVKGLEFRVVFIVALEESIFPVAQASLSKKDLEEERRICYVAITRAKERLIISHTNERFRFGEVRKMEPSRFLEEIIGFDVNNKKSKFKVRVVETSKQEINLGDKINHEKYGLGVVVAIEEEIIKVAFGIDYGIKIFKKGHPAIKKLEN